NDLVVTRKGEQLHPVWFLHLFDNHDAIRRWHVHQRLDGAVSVTLEVKCREIPLDRAALEQAIRTKLEGYPLTLEIGDHLPPRGSGKHRWIGSDLGMTVGQ